MKPRDVEIREEARLGILQSIFEDFQSFTQWTFSPDFGFASLSMATGKISLLEEIDCGSIGGYDPDNPCVQVTAFKQYDRFLTLLNKYHTEEDIEPVCGFDIRKMTKYFQELKQLRSKVLSEGK